MWKLLFQQSALLVVLTVWVPSSVAQECSTEKVNGDCNVTIDRSYPVVLPTIQMRAGKKVAVRIVHPLPFETLSLDLQSAQAVAGTDQTAAFLTAALPNLKGLLITTELDASKIKSMASTLSLGADASDPPEVRKYKEDIARLKLQMDQLFPLIDKFYTNAITIYEQLNEVLGTIPPEVLQNNKRLPGSKVSQGFPRPWVYDEYPKWRDWMTCEIAGQACPTQTEPSLRDLMADGTALATTLGPCPSPVNLQIISCQITQLQTQISNITDKKQQDFLSLLFRALNDESATLNADAAAITSVNKDLGNYFVNISNSQVISVIEPLGNIFDPLDKRSGRNSQIPKVLGRQAVFAVNGVNEVGAFVASVPTATQKKSIITITVLYADPIFEVSAGAFFSTLPDRSFANQTLVTQNPHASPTQGDVIITQSITRPTIVPFVAANWRLGHDFSWPDQRRGAFYFTGALGFNPYNTTLEFGVGPSLSWRSVMFSALFHAGHDVRLTQGEQLGEVWCNQSAASPSTPKCSGSPPSPSTEKFWTGAFAFGISVRVPSVFGGGGGSSGAAGSASH